MRNQYSSGLDRDPERLRVGYTYNATVAGTQEIDQSFPPAEANHYFVIEIRVRLKARPHSVGV